MFKPLLASKADLSKIKYPVLVSPKLDGIRCIMINGVAMSRSLKPIPNQYVQSCLAGLHGLDGELMLVEGDYNQVQSAIMSRDGEPDFVYMVFDSCNEPDMNLGFSQRVKEASAKVAEVRTPRVPVTCLKHIICHDEEDLLGSHDDFSTAGYEGTMIRSPDGPYKYGKSTVREGYLLKLKNFLDDEAIITGYKEKMINNNPVEKNELGGTKRSSNKANLSPAGTVGAILVDWKGEELSLGFGPGFDDKWKQWFWDNREEQIGKQVKFSYQELSKEGIPRFGKFIGFRTDDDL